MSYNNATGVITAPVSIDDVKTCLGVSTNDVAALCTNAQINMWAKYKPTSYPSAFSDEWYKGSDGNYGISLPAYVNSMTLLPSKYTADKVNGYGYKRPSGGSSSPYRLGDFRGYNHKADPPIGGFDLATNLSSSVQVTHSGFIQAYLAAEPGVSEGSNSLSLSVMGSLKDTYFGIAMINKSGKVPYYAISSSKISANTTEQLYVQLKPSGGFDVGLYTIYPFLSTQTNSEGFFYPLPSVSPCSMKVISDGDSILVDIYAWYEGGGNLGSALNKTKAYCRIESNESNKSYTNCKLYLMAGTSTIQSYTIGTIGTGFKKDYTFTGLSTSTSYKFRLTLNNGQYSKEMELDETVINPDY